MPVFFDKHLSYSWEKARTIYREAKELGIPMLAGSSAPLEVRSPDLEIPFSAPLSHAIALGYGDVDAYGFHTLEVLQCMVERRAGGETGIARVEMLEGERVWRWLQGDGTWAERLIDAALACFPDNPTGPLEAKVPRPVAFRLEYRDGLQAAVLLLGGLIESWGFAATGPDQVNPYATYVDDTRRSRSLPNFDGLAYCIEELFLTGRPMYPVERTLLTTGALAFAFESKRAGQPVETPELGIRYRPPARAFYQRR